jgi:hypothetical protein
MQHDNSGSLAAGAEMDCHAVSFEVLRLKSSRKRFDHAKKSNHAKKHSRQEYDAITGIPIAPQNLVIESVALVRCSDRHVCIWPIAADIALEPNVGFRGTADIVRSEHKANR